MIKGYLAAAALLALGLAGVGSLALQAAQRMEGAQDAKTPSGERSDTAMEPGPGRRPADPPRRAEEPMRERPATRPTATPDAGVPAARRPAPPDAGAPAARAVPDAAAPPASGPPRPAGPEPALVVEFREGSAKTTPADYRNVRDLVEKHGYKDVRYELTAYAAERRRAKNNRALARQRCHRVQRLLRKRGVSRRWLTCTDPVFRTQDGLATEAHRAPAWRRVEVRVKK